MKRILALLLALALLMAACGGGAPAASEDEGSSGSTGEPAATAPTETGETSTPDEAEEVTLDNIETPQDLQDILDRFTLLSYEFASPEDTMTVTFESLGAEEVNGKTADHVTFETTYGNDNASKLELWIGEEGETVKLVQDGQEMPAEVAQMMGTSVLMTLFWPFMTVDEMDLASVLEQGDSSSPFHVAHVSRDQKTFGDLTADVYVFEVTATTGTESGSYTWEAADFGSFQLLTRWEFSMASGGATDHAQFQITGIKLK